MRIPARQAWATEEWTRLGWRLLCADYRSRQSARNAVRREKEAHYRFDGTKRRLRVRCYVPRDKD